ncbi:mCG1041687 [Mus musculus]|nr:mCG1041687 [Mus musculus]EDM03254.1 rCG61989 [Rattus norvegicus]
MSRKEHN